MTATSQENAEAIQSMNWTALGMAGLAPWRIAF